MTTLQRATLAYIIPEWMFRFESVSRIAHEVYWICETCGPMEPLTCANGYMRRQCTCERTAREKVISTQKKTISTRCYSWLGQEYLADDLATKSFENFYPQHQKERAKEYHGHLAAARQYAAQIVEKQPVDNILMTGGYGTGKTHLATAICNHLRIHQVSCLFCTVPDLFDEMYSSSFLQQQELLNQASSTTLLVLDDLDKLHVRAETDGAFQKKKLFSILNRRYMRRAATIITANEQGELSRWLDDATISRLSERLTLMKMHGVDYRQRGKR
jgi:DNA replication protein DnaC